MPIDNPPKIRADALRNRERLLEAAREAFARDGAGASLDEIAKQSGVGSATLYRHYPTREALIQAVYHREVERLGSLGREFAASKPPAEALRCWMVTLVDHVVQKLVIAPALNEAAYADARVIIHETMQRLVQLAVENGDLRPDTMASDFLKVLIGVLQTGQGPDLHESAKRIVELLLRGATLRRA
jgi:AcrR family transcriptional regulator